MSDPSDALVIFTPSGPAGPVRRGHHGPRRRPVARRGHRLGLRRSWHLRSVPGRARAIGTFAKHGITSEPDHLSARPARSRPSTTGSADWRRIAASSCAARLLGDALIDVPPESQVHRQVVRKGVDVRDFADRSRRPAALRRGDAARARLAVGRSGPAARCARGRMGADRSRDATSTSSARSSRRSRPATTRSRVAVHDGRWLTGVWPGLPRSRRSASRSTSARPRSPATWPTWTTARSSPRPG